MNPWAPLVIPSGLNRPAKSKLLDKVMFVVPVAPAFNDYATTVGKYLNDRGVRSEIDLSEQRMNAKIRSAQTQKIPYMLVVGEKEQEANAVSIRTRSGEQHNGVSLEDCLSMIREKIERKETI